MHMKIGPLIKIFKMTAGAHIFSRIGINKLYKFHGYEKKKKKKRCRSRWDYLSDENGFGFLEA